MGLAAMPRPSRFNACAMVSSVQPVLQGEACEDCRVAGQHVEQAVAAVVVEEDFTGPAIGIEADGHLKLRTVALECDRLAGALVWQALAAALVSRGALAYFH